jgi:hypothetical protein
MFPPDMSSLLYGAPYGFPVVDPSAFQPSFFPSNPYFPGLAQQPQSLPFGYRPPLLQGPIPRIAAPFDFSFIPGPLGPLAGAVAAAPLQSFMTERGFLPGGTTPFANLYDQAQGYEFQRMQTEVQQFGAELDRQSLLSTFRGLAQVTGSPFGTEQLRQADRFGSFLTSITPFVAPFAPQIVEQFYGPQGSATILSQNLALQGRFRRDPITGQIGLSAETTRDLSETIQAGFASDLGNRFAGTTLGETGVLFGELQRRGLLPEAGGGAGDRGGDASDRTADLSRIQERLGNYAGVIQAMREIFGDAGNPNAPIPQLVQALDQLTQGTFATRGADQLQDTVRNIRNLSQLTGLGIEGFTRLSEYAGGLARQQGLSGEAALQATLGAASFTGALTQSGRLSTPGIGTLEELAQRDIALREQGLRSRTGGQVAVIQRLFGDPEGLDRLRQQAQGGSPEQEAALAFAQAVIGNEDRFVDPRTGQRRGIGEFSDSEFAELFRGVVTGGEATITQLAGQEGVNIETLERVNAQGLIRRAQISDIFGKNQFVESRIRGALSNTEGVDRPALARQLTDTLFGGIQRTSNRDELTQIVSQDLAKTVGTERADTIAELVVGEVSEGLKATANLNLQQASALFNPALNEEAAAFDRQAARRNRIQEALAPLSANRGFLANAVKALQTANPDTTIGDILSQVPGGVPADQIRATLERERVDPEELGKYFNDLLKSTRATTSGPAVSSEQAANLAGLGRFLETTGREAEGLLPDQAKDVINRELVQGENKTTFGQGAADFLSGVENLAIRSLQDPSLRGRFDDTMQTRLRESLAGTQQLRSLASLYSGGDVGQLLAGQLTGVSETSRTDVLGIVRRLQGELTQVAQDSQQLLEGTVSPDDLARRAKASEEAAKDLPGASIGDLMGRYAQTFGVPIDSKTLKDAMTGKEETSYDAITAFERLKEISTDAKASVPTLLTQLQKAESGKAEDLAALETATGGRGQEALLLYQRTGGSRRAWRPDGSAVVDRRRGPALLGSHP